MSVSVLSLSLVVVVVVASRVSTVYSAILFYLSGPNTFILLPVR